MKGMLQVLAIVTVIAVAVVLFANGQTADAGFGCGYGYGYTSYYVTPVYNYCAPVYPVYNYYPTYFGGFHRCW